jgi:hypothetical protein
VVQDESKSSNDIKILDVYLELPEEMEKKKTELSAAAQKVLDSELDMDLMVWSEFHSYITIFKLTICVRRKINLS